MNPVGYKEEVTTSDQKQKKQKEEVRILILAVVARPMDEMESVFARQELYSRGFFKLYAPGQ